MSGSEEGTLCSFRPVPAADRIVRDLGPMTLIHHRASGITHMVSEPVPQILEALDMLGSGNAGLVAGCLVARYDLLSDDGSGVETIVEARLEELAVLGLVVRA